MRYDASIEHVLRHVESTEGWYLDGDRLRRKLPCGAVGCPTSGDLSWHHQVEWSDDQGIELQARRDLCDAADKSTAYLREHAPQLVALRERLLKAAGV